MNSVPTILFIPDKKNFHTLLIKAGVVQCMENIVHDESNAKKRYEKNKSYLGNGCLAILNRFTYRITMLFPQHLLFVAWASL